MSEQSITNGKYKLQLARGQQAVRSVPEVPHFVLLPDEDDGTDTWDVAFDGKDSYTLQNVKTGLYLGGKSDPTAMAPMMAGGPEPFAWTIQRSEEDPEAFTLSPRASNGTMRLSPSILRIFPPPVAWLPPGGPEQVWRLVGV